MALMVTVMADGAWCLGCARGDPAGDRGAMDGSTRAMTLAATFEKS
jgi:hypothetical protein